MSLPLVQTAMPLRRYSVSDIEFTVLGEIVTRDDRDYRYLLAAVPMGEPKPLLFLSCEPLPEGGFGMYAYTQFEAKPVGAKDDWGDVDVFATDAMMIADKLLKLDGQEAVRLL
ncbi:MAG: hypothetical protein H6981_13950 [Gammaproteobacteria bacterium]|nr:hypothetical protein [Gammaproteobacteria bacterium]MCP5137887.1 hypothetical protein [Gammaproteobacteria bacterium]